MDKISKVEIASEDEAEGCDAVICVRLTQPLLLPDNVIALCSQCGEAIQHRPHVPKAPVKICMECISTIVSADDTVTTVITPETAAEVAAHWRKRNAN